MTGEVGVLEVSQKSKMTSVHKNLVTEDEENILFARLILFLFFILCML